MEKRLDIHERHEVRAGGLRSLRRWRANHLLLVFLFPLLSISGSEIGMFRGGELLYGRQGTRLDCGRSRVDGRRRRRLRGSDEPLRVDREASARYRLLAQVGQYFGHQEQRGGRVPAALPALLAEDLRLLGLAGHVNCLQSVSCKESGVAGLGRERGSGPALNDRLSSHLGTRAQGTFDEGRLVVHNGGSTGGAVA